MRCFRNEHRHNRDGKDHETLRKRKAKMRNISAIFVLSAVLLIMQGGDCWGDSTIEQDVSVLNSKYEISYIDQFFQILNPFSLFSTLERILKERKLHYDDEYDFILIRHGATNCAVEHFRTEAWKKAIEKGKEYWKQNCNPWLACLGCPKAVQIEAAQVAWSTYMDAMLTYVRDIRRAQNKAF